MRKIRAISIHSLPKEGDCKKLSRIKRFQSTPSPRRETTISATGEVTEFISIHSLPKEGDFLHPPQFRQFLHFNPLPPQGGRHVKYAVLTYNASDFNPLPPQGGRPELLDQQFSALAISIHSLPKEGDKGSCIPHSYLLYFNPLPPQGGRHIALATARTARRFQSTPSPRRETDDLALIVVPYVISIHSLPKEGDPPMPNRFQYNLISIHSLPKEGDMHIAQRAIAPGYISIHSLPKEGDKHYLRCRLMWRHFNPLPPQGGRLPLFLLLTKMRSFQSTPSPRRET